MSVIIQKQHIHLKLFLAHIGTVLHVPNIIIIKILLCHFDITSLELSVKLNQF